LATFYFAILFKAYYWTLRKNEETCLDAFDIQRAEKDSAGFVDSKENK